jgi:hypothetical protein
LQLAFLTEVAGNEVPVIEEQDPHRKSYTRQQIFVHYLHKITAARRQPGRSSNLQLIF